MDSEVGNQLTAEIGEGTWAGDWFDLLRASGLEPRKRTLLVEAQVADSFVAPLLKVPIGSPILRFERQLQIGSSGFREFGVSFFRADLIAFSFGDECAVSDLNT